MDLSNITIRNLEYIVAVAEEGHFGRAAQRCNVSQPALSAQIHKLESSLDTPIFERNGRSVRTTPNGFEIIEHARKVLDEVKSLGLVSQRTTRPLSGPFRLGVIATLGAYLLPHLLGNLRRGYADLELALVEGLTDPLLEQLRIGHLDAVLASLPIPEEPFLIEKLFSEPFWLAIPKGHRLEKEKKLTLSLLKPQEMILLDDGHCLRDQALAVCTSQDKTLRERFRATSLETLRQMIAGGVGYTLFPALAVPEPVSMGDLVSYRRFEDASPSRIIGLVYRKGSSAAKDSREFSDFVRGHLPDGVEPVGRPV